MLNYFKAVIFLFLVFFSTSLYSKEVHSLVEVSKLTIQQYFDNPKFSSKELTKQFKVSNEYKKAAGLFVTLSKNGKTRACWGSVTPQESDLVKATISSTLGALNKEYRYAPINKAEINDLKVQVTVIKALQPIKNISGQNPLRDGLFLRSNSRSAVILPGEALDAHYQLVMCKVKAGLSPHDHFQLYRLKADVYK